MGGIHASLRPEEALQHVDCIVTGEAEALWPLVVADLEAGALKQRYDAVGFPPMDEIPAPAWGKGKPDDYLFHQVQTTRGCPFRCRFCSVPDISGQDFRFKPVEHVIAELRALPKSKGPIASGKPLYIVDDNFISRTRYTKDLLRAMIPLARNKEIPNWSAETTLNVANDEEMLDLFRDAGCATLIIGFESVTEASLAAMDKPVNFCLTYQEAIDRIHARGMTIIGNFIVGFDTDTLGLFKQTLDFVQQSGILYPFFSILTPMPGTKLFEDYKAAGRLDHENWHLYGVDLPSGNVRDYTPFQGVRADLIGEHPDVRDQVLVQLNLRKRDLMDVYRLTLSTGALTLDTENPGDVAAFIADHKLQGFTPDGQGLYLSSSLQGDTARLVERPLTAPASAKERVIAQSPDADLADVARHPRSGAVQAAAFAPDRTRWTVVDPAVQADFAALAKLAEVKVFASEAEWADAAQAAPTAVVGDARLALFMQVDVAAEKARLAKEAARLQGELAKAQGKLGNAAFTAKAPPAVIEQEQKRVADFGAALEKIQAQLARLG
jgi:hypothetical protein